MDRKDYIRAKTDILWSKLYNYRRFNTEYLFLQDELAKLDEKVKDLQKPKGISLSDDRVQNPKSQDTILLEIFTKQKQVEKEMLLAFGKMSEIRTIINLIEDDDIKGIAIKKFINDVSWDELAHEYCCDRGTLVYKIKKELSKFLHFSQCEKD
ncbi:hypothetical protein B5F14_06515 [Faecalitalea cylindroides]|jgi:hypothetical protein|uniref:Uncharacterized protein n=1 Tax=Faecalitalea cylindroides TaxID=39483 RepID=A0A1Y4LTV5_9FIRM|nr:DUF1492 domain-containing protein [Faecalitalea cylindroides]OUP60067.1 hypothetical protein B5F14_06515 [Faecalitalea cylindroides]